MKLTKSDREAFVAAVMDDVPQIDYDELAEKRATEIITAAYPAPVKAIYDDKKLREYINTQYVGLPGCLQNFYGPKNFGAELYENEELNALSEKKRAQDAAYQALRLDVTAVINSCPTLKVAKERLPEFEKYLPADRDGSGLANLPAVANVVAGLTKAGWPKGQERAAA